MNSEPLSVSRPRSRNGRICRTVVSACRMSASVRRSNTRHSVQPVATSVNTRVWRKGPSELAPQCATRSRFREYRPRVRPVRECANRNSVFESLYGLGGGLAVRSMIDSELTEDPIRRGGTQVQQARPRFI